MKQIPRPLVIATMVCLLPFSAYAQTDNLHGDETYSLNGLHSGNQIKTTFYNDGMMGERRTTSPDDFGVEWPINSGTHYMSKLSVFFGSLVEDIEGNLIPIISEANGTRTGGLENSPSSGDWGPYGEWWSMAPLPGFANTDPGEESYDDNPHIAMSHWDWSWPVYWPDKLEDAIDPGWPGSWNGYFGKARTADEMNADQESYYVMDDYNNREWPFYPDATDSSRRGLGFRVTVRGLQWSQALVEDNIFWLFDVKNIGTYSHDKVNFGMINSPGVGASRGVYGDQEDDGGAYDLEEDLGYNYDNDNIGDTGWSPVGLVGVAFFESPGNPFDGIDNDGDATTAGSVISQEMFQPIVYTVGDPIVLIDYETFERTVTTMPADGVTVTYLGREYRFEPGMEYREIPVDLIDNNLNGIIDENNGSTFGEGEDAIFRYLYDGLRYVNYLAGETNDPYSMIDERRDDDIDNDGDWDAEYDDLGMDGARGTDDPGEGDGRPTSGVGTDLTGEKHIDKTDIKESDMIGLTAFNIFTPWTIYPLYDDERLWGTDEFPGIRPGFLNATGQIGVTDLLLGSGYFPLFPGQIERFSVGFIMGYGTPNNIDELGRNKRYAEQAYLQNYNFAKAPLIPKLTAVAGDGRVTLYWDDAAEGSIDPITGKDFEGYRIYRSTDREWKDMTAITDGFGSVVYRQPLAQFDYDNGVRGYPQTDVNGVKFWLGKDTGLVHTYVDSMVTNGQLYYYAVTSYDRGADSLTIAPAECSKYISMRSSGELDMGNNVAFARPESPAAGYRPAHLDSSGIIKLPGSTADGYLTYQIVDPTKIRDEHTYRITFEDTANLKTRLTTNYSLTDVTSGEVKIDRGEHFGDGDVTPFVDGFTLTFHENPQELILNSAMSGWDITGIYPLSVVPYRREPVELMPGDYQLIIGDVGIDTSSVYDLGAAVLPAIPVNFTIWNTTLNKKVDFAFRERDMLEGMEGVFSTATSGLRTDEIIMLKDSLTASWHITLERTGTDTLLPSIGAVANLVFDKPFLSNDTLEFKINGARIDKDLAKNQMDKIKVVPNPYIVTNLWEPQNPYSTGRGPRELHFTHLPEKCTIKIFNVRGQLVQILDHDSPFQADGTEIWDMKTLDQLEIGYGAYIFHVDAGELGEKIGKFAVIK